IYGDGVDMPAGSWGELKTFAEAPSGGNYIYKCAFLDKTHVFMCFYIEKFGGNEAYSHPFCSHTLAGTGFSENLWREPQPFNLTSECGLAIAHHGNYCWLSGANGVWRASLIEQGLDLTADILSLKQETNGLDGKLTVELANDNAKFASLPAPLSIGCRLDFSPGYVTSQGNEVSNGQSFALEAYEYTSSGGTSKLVIYAVNCLHNIKRWTAKQQFRWNKDSKDTSVKDILAFILVRAGLKLEFISESEIITGFYPDFSINPGTRGDSVIKKLLSYVPDLLFIEGDTAYLVNPLANDAPVHSYATPQNAAIHPVIEGSYRTGTPDYNHIQVGGFDCANLQSITTHSFDWEEIGNVYERYSRIEDVNINSISIGQARGKAVLIKYEMESSNGYIKIPVNCGQQVYDVIDITDIRAGLSSQKRRILGFNLFYNPSRGQYIQNLILGMP
ncbi:MAG: hypothetical protein PHE15_04545, partial [Dehalococcoidales bacterium]|nr:hypothetical protein [Dehalococcoidales bacterium]